MGGRGGASGIEPQGRKMSIERFLQNLQKNSRDGMLDSISKANLSVYPATFTKNGNAVSLQTAEFSNGENRVVVSFTNRWEPMQVARPTQPIKQAIEVRVYKNGDITAMRTLEERKSKSLKNAGKNYGELLDRWKKLTKQKNISFR